MTQPPVPSPPPPLPPPPPPTASPSQPSEGFRCAGCRMIVTVAPGLAELACPTCRMPQMLLSELMARAHQTARSQSPLTPPSQNKSAHGIDPAKISFPVLPARFTQLDCARLVFDASTLRDGVSFKALITGYVS